MDSGWSEPTAHEMAKDRKWEDIIKLSPFEIENILIKASITPKMQVNSGGIFNWWLTTNGTWRFKKITGGYDFEFTFKGDDYKYRWNRNTEKIIEDEMSFEGLGSLFGGKNSNSWWSWRELAMGKLNPYFDSVEVTKIMKDMDGKQSILKDVVAKVDGGKYRNYGAWFPESINRVDVLDSFVPVKRCKHGIDNRNDCKQCDDWLGDLFS